MGWGTFLSLRHLRTRKKFAEETFQPISILKPLKGTDADLRSNLESFFNLDYPKFEIIFSVADPLDPSVPIVQNLIRKYPAINSKLIIGSLDVSLNPKVNNLIKSYHQLTWPA